jgi:hypothetical protein
MGIADAIAFVVVILVLLAVVYTATSLWSWMRGSRKNRLPYVLRNFFGRDPYQLPIVNRSFITVDLPNLHLAVTNYIQVTETSARLIGYLSSGYQNSLRELIADRGLLASISLGPVQYREVDVDVDKRMHCVEHGIHLIQSRSGRIAAHGYFNEMRGRLELEVMAETPEQGMTFIEDVRKRAIQDNVYRRKVISLECNAEQWGRHGCGNIRFHSFPAIHRDEIILPDAVLDLIERNTVRFFRHAAELRKSGRSVKRGLLLHGQPGTGKTYTAKWLARSLEGVTVLLLSGEQLWLIKECCQIARMLAPALVIMEDVDLIATERDERRHPVYQITLHQLLNEMDGLTSEAEVIFLLTTNRPQAIEPALAARPGRIDQAIEFPLPDTNCRRRLLRLYGRGLDLALADEDRLIARTDGASPAFIQELMRKAALIAAEENSVSKTGIRVTDTQCDAALRELVLAGGGLTRSLLGFAGGPDPSTLLTKLTN